MLVIDDDPTVHALMHRFLEKERFQIESALSAQDGLTRARELRPAVITLDVLMPSMDGWTVLAALKSDPDLANIPVIMLTLLDNQNIGYTLGASDYLLKPIDRSRLLCVLRQYCSEFTLTPLTQDGPAPSILIVEDDSITRDMVRTMLEDEGWQVLEARNGREGLEQLESHRPGLILLDLMMAEIDGFGFVAALQKREEWRSIPIVVVTAKDITEAESQRLQGQVKQILEKGAYSCEELFTTVRHLVTKCSAEGTL